MEQDLPFKPGEEVPKGYGEFGYGHIVDELEDVEPDPKSQTPYRDLMLAYHNNLYGFGDIPVEIEEEFDIDDLIERSGNEDAPEQEAAEVVDEVRSLYRRLQDLSEDDEGA